MLKTKPPKYQAAFTLLELIVVIAVLAIVATYVLTRPDSSSAYRNDSVIEQIISSGRLAQQLSMNDSARAFVLSIQANQVNLLVDGSPFVSGNMSYPLNFGSQVTLSPITNITFSSLGETTATTINVQVDTTNQVCFEASGHIQRC
ncbi:type II secretion system protein [Aliikangiella sp. IMCC44359]|uniref:type II secretion system protein n=1 Tax=Aliikangiella sp. IMCC44359 TaxID=3459125 RepID=UPI00403AE39A